MKNNFYLGLKFWSMAKKVKLNQKKASIIFLCLSNKGHIASQSCAIII